MDAALPGAESTPAKNRDAHARVGRLRADDSLNPKIAARAAMTPTFPRPPADDADDPARAPSRRSPPPRGERPAPPTRPREPPRRPGHGRRRDVPGPAAAKAPARNSETAIAALPSAPRPNPGTTSTDHAPCRLLRPHSDRSLHVLSRQASIPLPTTARAPPAPPQAPSTMVV